MKGKSKMKKKIVKTWAVIPNDFEYSVQYCDTKEQAEMMRDSFFKGEASISEMEQRQDVINRKNRKTAMRGYLV